MENSIDGDTDCSEKCPTDRCFLLDKRDKQATINIPDDEGDDGDDEDEDEDKNERIIIGKSISQQNESRSVIIPNINGELYSLSTTNGNHDNLTVNHHNEIDNKSEHNQHQQGNNQINSLDQMNPSESHNHSENDLSDLVAKSKRFPRLNKEKKISDQDAVINNNDSSVDHDALNSMVNSSSTSPKSFETCLHPNGIVTNNLINNIHPHTLNINITNPGNHFYCPNNNNYHNYGACNGKSLNSSKCVRRLISSDSGGSNKSSSKSGRKSRSGGPPQSPPDGGWGWVVVFASFMISLIADGVSLSYGFFQMDLSEHFGQSKGKTALVGSLLLSMPALTGPIASALTDRYGCRSMTIVSGLLSASGFILGSFARSLEHLFIAFSITGIGLSLSYVTSIVIVAYYFNTKRSFATGLAVCGTGIGTFLFAPLTTYLLKEFSWRGTLLIMSGFFLNIIVFGALMRDINVSEVDSISGQESDSDEDSVIEPLGRTCNNNNTIGCSCGFQCCQHQQNNLKSGCGANNLILNGSQCSSIDVNNRNSFPLNQTSSPSTEKFHLCNRLSQHHYDSLTSNNNNNAPTKSSSSSTKPLSSICINSHCSSSILPNDEQSSNYEAHCKVTKLFHEPDHHNQCNHHQVYAHNNNHHHQQCNHHSTNSRRFQRFQSSYSSTKPKSDLKNYSSLVNIPTYITTDSSVSKDVLDEISGRKDGNLNQLLQKYPDLLSNLINRDQEKSFFLSSGVIGQNDCIGKDQVKGKGQPIPIPIPETTTTTSFISKHNKSDHLMVNNHKVNDSSESRPRRFKGVGGDLESGLSVPTRNTVINVNRLKIGTGNNLIGSVGIGGGTGKDGFGSKLQRASLTYRTAVFRDVRRYRLRSSSAPDIYTNSMVTIAERESFLQDIKQVIVDSVDLSIFKNVRFAIFCFSNLLLHGCIDVPYVYLPDHAISSGICVKEMAFYLISVLGIANTLGTIIVGYIGDKPWLRPSTWYSGLTALGGISMALIPMARNYYLLAVLAAFYGFSVSANYTLVSVILVEIISLDKFTNAYGLMLLVQGIGTMLGPPIAGWLFDISGDYDTTFYVIGLCVLASGIIVFPLNESLSLASSSSSSSSSKGSSMTESPSRTSSPVEDKITVLSSNKTLFDKEPSP